MRQSPVFFSFLPPKPMVGFVQGPEPVLSISGMSAEDGRTGAPFFSGDLVQASKQTLSSKNCIVLTVHVCTFACSIQGFFFFSPLVAILSKPDTMSLVAYRNLMRAARIAFQGNTHSLQNLAVIYNLKILRGANNFLQATSMSFLLPRTRSDRASKRIACWTPIPASRPQLDMPRTWPKSCVKTWSRGKRWKAKATIILIVRFADRKNLCPRCCRHANVFQQSCEYTNTPREAIMTAL